MAEEAVKEKTPSADVIMLNEPDVIPDAKVDSPTREELKSKGWSAKEMDAAEKRGMVKKSEEKKETPAKAEVPLVIEENKEIPAESKEEPKKDFSHSQHLREMELTPDQEKTLRDTFPFANGKMNPVEALYWRSKNERRDRQDAEAKARDLEAKLLQVQKDLEIIKLNGMKPEVDENGNEIDSEDKPLTMRAIKEMQAKEAEEKRRQEEQDRVQGHKVADAMKDQEEYAKTIYPDYDATVNLAKDLIHNLDALVPERWRQERVLELVRDLQIKAAQADKYGIDSYNAALLSYEIGRFHPNYGKAKNGNSAESNDGKSPTKANGSLTPEQMERMEKNTQRRGSSASIPAGGGRRVVSAEDVTLQDLTKMSSDQRQTFRKNHPDKYLKLLRG